MLHSLNPMRFVLVILSITSSACAHPSFTEHRGDEWTIDSDHQVVLARSQILADAWTSDDPFADNLTIGHLHHEGGFVAENKHGSQVRSKKVTLQNEDDMKTLAQQWVDERFTHILKARGTVVESMPPIEERFGAPKKENIRGSTPRDGKDNISLPRYHLKPTPLNKELLNALTDSGDVLIVPYVVHYYTHNAGWFVGQTWGCSGGARFRVFWTAYDLKTGQVISYQDIDAWELSQRIHQPSRTQLEDFQALTEKRVAQALTHFQPARGGGPIAEC